MGLSTGSDLRFVLSSWLHYVYCLIMYTSIITGIQGLNRALSVIIILNLPVDPVVLGLAFFGPLFVYGRDRIMDNDSDMLNTTNNRIRWIYTHKRGLSILVKTSGAMIIILTLLRLQIWPYILGGLFISLMYTVKWMPGGRSVKQLPGVKTPYVGAVWVLLTVVNPIVVGGRQWDERSIIIGFIIFLLTCTIITMNDLQDIVVDTATNTKTIPVLFGEHGARFIAFIFAATAATLAAYSLHSTGLWLAAWYHCMYAYCPTQSKHKSNGDYVPHVIMYRASSFVILACTIKFG